MENRRGTSTAHCNRNLLTFQQVSVIDCVGFPFEQNQSLKYRYTIFWKPLRINAKSWIELAADLPPTCFIHDLCQQVGSERGHLTRFAHHCTPSCNRRGNLECEKIEGEVPGTDESSHAHWRRAGIVDGIHLWKHCGSKTHKEVP